LTQDPIPGNGFTTVSPTGDHGPRNDKGADPSILSHEQEAYILSISLEGKVYKSIKELFRKTDLLSRCSDPGYCAPDPEPTAQKNRRLNASNLVPLEKRKTR
jgi:hypothetical protein